MSILNRLKKLETTRQDSEHLYLFTWQTDEIKRIESGESIIYRNEYETEEDFKSRAETELLKIGNHKDKMLFAWADCSTF